MRLGIGPLLLAGSLFCLIGLYLYDPSAVHEKSSNAYREVQEHVVAPVADRLPAWDWSTPAGPPGWNAMLEEENRLEGTSPLGEQEYEPVLPSGEGETASAAVSQKVEISPSVTAEDGPAAGVEGLARLDSKPLPEKEAAPAALDQLDDEDDEDDMPPTLPPCKKTFIIHLRGSRGLASEFNRVIKMATIGEYYGYEVLLQQSQWMYGRYENYFTMPTPRCSTDSMPGGDKKRRPFIKSGMPEFNGKPAFTKFAHVQDGNTELDYTDELFIRIATDAESMKALHTTEIDRYPEALPLSGARTVPEELWEAFGLAAVQAKKWWNLNPATRQMVDALKAGLGWNEEGKRPIVGMHIRLGDKCVETANTKYSPLRFASAAVVKKKKSQQPVCAQQAEAGGMDALHASIYIKAGNAAVAALATGESSALQERPIVAIMSDDVGVVNKLEAGEVEKDFEILLLPERAAKISKAQGMSGGKDMAKLDDGFSPQRFDSLSIKSRTSLTRRFIRDLTLLAEEADAFVFTGSSNVGRLGALLGGVDKAKAGRYISCDSRWFPTAHYT